MGNDLEQSATQVSALKWQSSKAMSEDFWQWSCQVYQQQDVGKLCLAIQDELNLNVNYLLLALWAERHKLLIEQGLWAEIIQNGSQAEEAVLHIRSRRHELKQRSEAAYQQALLIELKAEKLVQEHSIQVLFKKNQRLVSDFAVFQEPLINLKNYLCQQQIEPADQEVVFQLGSLLQSLSF